MLDYRLKVFYTVANRLSFTRAADELFISQPAVTKHIKELENQLKTKLFERKGITISLTPSGEILKKHAGEIRNIYQEIEFEISQLTQKSKGKLRIGASTTIAQYILPEILARFNKYYKDIGIELLTNNTEAISNLLEKNRIDIGMIEGPAHSASFEDIPFLKDEIVLIARANHTLANKTISLQDLYNVSLIMREQGSGTQETIFTQLKKARIKPEKLKVVMTLGSSESIKNYLRNSDCLAFLSINTVLQELKNNQLTIIDIKGFEMERHFRFILPKGNQSELIKLFMRFVQS